MSHTDRSAFYFGFSESFAFSIDSKRKILYNIFVDVSTVEYALVVRGLRMNFNHLNLLLKYAKEYGHGKIRVLGMSDTEHIICTFLFGHTDVSQDDVAQSLRLDRTTVARALLTLENKGFVRRRPNPENRRKNLLSLTDAGRGNIAAVVGLYDHWLSEISGCLTDAEQKQFDEICTRLLAAAKAVSEETSGSLDAAASVLE